MISFKKFHMLTKLLEVGWHPNIFELLGWLDEEVLSIVVTSTYRPYDSAQSDSGVHSTIPLRGTDIRSYIYKDAQELVDKINKKFEYDPDRPDMKCAVLHDTGRGIHIHLQVHDNTRWR